MKIGVSSYSFSRYRAATGATLSDICRKAHEIGFDAIEFITLDEGDRIAQAREIRATCDELGLDISAYTVGANFLAEDAEAMVGEVCAAVDVAKAMGAPVLRHDVGWTLPEGMDWKEAVLKIAPYIRRVTEYAAALGIRTCTENHGFVFQDSERLAYLIDTVAHPNYGWLIDLGNFLCVDEDPRTAIQTAVPYAFHAHAKDFIFRAPSELNPEGFICTRGGNFIRGTVLGHGVVPLVDCVRALKASGYAGTLSLEFEGREEVIPAIEMGYRYLRQLAEL